MLSGVQAEDTGPLNGGLYVLSLSHALAYVLCTGVAPITQYTYLRNKNSNTQGSSPNVVKVLLIP